MKLVDEFNKKFNEVYEGNSDDIKSLIARNTVILEACFNIMHDYGISEDEIYKRAIHILNQIKMT